ncbi:hypothetical protein N7528_004659 [Penicillium herquei]|nr:hypothetical protein N7528_004659 [Penicillium herquei]
MSTSILRVGILGASPTNQTTLLSTIHSLPKLFKLTIIYHPSNAAAKVYQDQFKIPHSTTCASDIITHPEVDLVVNLLPFESHEAYTIIALEAGKHVMVEVPLSMSPNGLRRINAAKKKGTTATTQPKLFVGCARRYAPCFTDIFKKELASLGRIYYARCRNIAGPLHTQPPLEAPTPTPTPIHLAPESAKENSHPRVRTNGSLTRLQAEAESNGITSIPTLPVFNTILSEVFGSTDDLTPDRVAFCRFLGNLGCHDLSIMRESLGFPDAVANVAITDPFYSAIFRYTDSRDKVIEGTDSYGGEDGEIVDGHPFTVMYETGMDSVPRCDSHLTVYGATKTISVEYDFPYLASTEASEGGIVRVVIEESESDDDKLIAANGSENVVINGKNGLRHRVKRTEFVSSAAEAYEREFLAMHAYFTETEVRESGVEAKTTDDDAWMDLKLLRMIFKHYDRQCGTIRTPLG